MRSVRQTTPKCQPAVGAAPAAARQLAIPPDDGTVMLALIQALIPVGLQAVEQALAQEVTALVGAQPTPLGISHPSRVSLRQ